MSHTTAHPGLDEAITQVLALLQGGQAHAGLDDAVRDFPAELRGKVPVGLPYSAWQLLEHLRIAQRDILNFSSPPTSGYQPMQWPEDYWPKSAEPPTPYAWEQTVAAIHNDRDEFETLLTEPGADLFEPFRWGDGQNLFREALIMCGVTTSSAHEHMMAAAYGCST